MKLSHYIFGGMAALALMVAVPAYAEMTTVADSDLDGIAAKGDASVAFAGYSWTDTHAADSSEHKGAVDNGAAAVNTESGINTANVWGTYAGAEAFGPGGTGVDTTSSATSNAGIGGF